MIQVLRKNFGVVFIVMMNTMRAFSQEQIPSSDTLIREQEKLPINAYTGFEHLLNTSHWNIAGNYEHSFGNYVIGLQENFRSTVIRSRMNFIKDEQTVSAFAKKMLSNNTQMQLQFTSFLFSDNQTLGIYDASSHAVYGGLRYIPASRMALEPLVGFRWENQMRNFDQGISYQLSAHAQELELEGFTSAFRLQFHRDDLTPRRLEHHRAEISVAKVFEGKTANTVSLFFSKNRREFYLQNTDAIDRRIEQTISVSDALTYEFGTPLLFSFTGNVFKRTIEKTPYLTINEMKIETAGELVYTVRDSFRAVARLSYFERDEQHLEQSLINPQFKSVSPTLFPTNEKLQDNFSQRTMLNASVNVPLSQSDRCFLQASASILRYDTPSRENVEDRDELWYVFSVATMHKISPVVQLNFYTDASAMHLVYLFSERSANNSWNRILRASPVVKFSPSDKFVIVNTFEVLANYTVYDFEDLLGNTTRSFSFRQFSFLDSASFRVARRTALIWYSQLKLYGRGELRWKAFKEYPLASFEEQTYIPQLRFMMENDSYLSTGLRIFKRKQFSGSGTSKKTEHTLLYLGPLANVILNFHNRTTLIISGWYEFSVEPKLERRRNSNLSLQLNVKM
ncbi:MAG: hypothetical protein FJ218_07805 [Ignavibacteria bacterium]|nr:hypothetical protein [Ignavibacteria bacterium]